jgi:glycosyltransferase involved in cell wall biosynthesis
MSTISVCITTFNRARLLDRTLASLAGQVRRPDEVIISDDCSSDDTEAVAHKWRAEFRAYTYRRNTANLYMPGNLNACVSTATGNYVANLHDADVFDPTLLQKWEAALDQHPSAGFVFCGVSTGDETPTDETPQRVHRLNRSTVVSEYGSRAVYLHDVEPFTDGRAFFERHMLHATYSIVWGTVMARRSVYQELLPFDTQFGFISDVDMWMRICRRHDVAYVREPLIHLDDSPTAERKFDWNRMETLRRMQRANIERFYATSQQLLRRELARHSDVFRRWYAWKTLTLGLRGRARLAEAGLRLLVRPRSCT